MCSNIKWEDNGYIKEYYLSHKKSCLWCRHSYNTTKYISNNSKIFCKKEKFVGYRDNGIYSNGDGELEYIAIDCSFFNAGIFEIKVIKK